MPTSGKLFLYREDLNVSEIRDKLENWEEILHDSEIDVTLRKDIELSTIFDDTLNGIFSEDKTRSDIFRGTLQVTPYTVESGFSFFSVAGAPYCVVLASKGIANGVANALSVILHGEVGAITLPVLNIMKLKELYEAGEATKIALFDNIDIPNMDKGTLYGMNVIQTDWYGRFINMGTPWYVVFKDKIKGYTVGLVRDGTVVIFSTVDAEGFLNYVKEEVTPLVARRTAE